MRIPKVGSQVLFVLTPASPADNRQAEVRPAVITKVWGYGPDRATVNLIVTLDGNDIDAVASTPGSNVNGFHMSVTSATFSASLETPNSFHYDDGKIHKCEAVEMTLEITHGREKIRAGAMAIWDQAKDMLTFTREDVTGIGADQVASYPAGDFINRHAPRIRLPKGYQMTLAEMETDGTESPEERTFVVADLIRQHMDEEYRHDRLNGMPPVLPGSLRKAWEKRRAEKARPALPAGTVERPMLEVDLPQPGDTKAATPRRSPDEAMAGTGV